MTPAWGRSTVVQLAPQVVIQLTDGALSVGCGEPFEFLPHSFLPILAFFLSPRTLGEGLETLGHQAKGIQGLADDFGILLRLCEAGVLVRPGTAHASLSARVSEGFGPPGQIRMIEDRARTAALLDAVRMAVRPGDVVLDLGTGTGLLAVAAAKAGARQVYAVESGMIAGHSQRLIDGAGLGSCIKLLRGRSVDLDLPERVDLMVSEILGHDPFSERLLETFADAVPRFLRPSGRVLPSRVRLLATAVEVPARTRDRFLFTPRLLERWARRTGLPFEVLADPEGSGTALQLALVRPLLARTWKRLGGPVPLVDLNLLAGPDLPLEAHGVVPIVQPGACGGVLLHFEADLGSGQILTSDPDRSQSTQHWKCPLWLLPGPRDLAVGQDLPIHYSYRRGISTLALVGGNSQGTES